MKAQHMTRTGWCVAAISAALAVYFSQEASTGELYVGLPKRAFCLAVAVGAVAMVLNIHSWRVFSNIFVRSADRERSVAGRLYSLIALKSLFILLIVGGLMLAGVSYILPALVGYGVPLVLGLIFSLFSCDTD